MFGESLLETVPLGKFLDGSVRPVLEGTVLTVDGDERYKLPGAVPTIS